MRRATAREQREQVANIHGRREPAQRAHLRVSLIAGPPERNRSPSFDTTMWAMCATGGVNSSSSLRQCVTVAACVVAAAITWPSALFGQTWNFPGMSNDAFNTLPAGGPAPRRDLTGLWDAGSAGIGGQGQAEAREAARAPFTALGEQMMSRNKPGNGPRAAPVAENNDPLSTVGDPSGFPRILNYELRTVQMVHTPDQVLMLYAFNQTWRVIWTDGRKLPEDPDPRWFGYSVGRWEDDTTFVVDTVGLDPRSWIDNNGYPHSDALRVVERYHRVNQNTLELTVTIDDPLVYTRPWLSRDRLPLKRLPAGTDVLEMIYTASDARNYKESISSQVK
jgi:hypothetical protein